MGDGWSAKGASARLGRPARVFVSYARADADFLRAISSHLATLRAANLISDWHDGEIVPGEAWGETIRQRLDEADIIVLLLSADFFSSESTQRIDLPRALERQSAGTARVVPIVVRAVDWKHTPLARLRALPDNGKAVKSWPDQDEAWMNVAEGIRRLVESLGPPGLATAPGRSSTMGSPPSPPGADGTGGPWPEGPTGGVVARIEFVGVGNDVERRAMARGNSLTVGRASDMDVRIDDSLVSSRHAQFIADEAGLRVLDLGSKNHLFVNGVERNEAVLRAGDEVRLGRRGPLFRVVESLAATRTEQPE